MSLLTNLVSYWKLDESSGDAADSTANANTLVNTNTVTYSAGKINNGANFASASEEYFSKASAAGFVEMANLTYSGWFKFSALNTVYALWVKMNDAGNDFNLFFYFHGAAGGFGMSSGGTGDGFVSHGGAIASTGVWYYVTFTYTGSTHTLEVFVNGSSIGTANTASITAIPASTGIIYIGGDAAAGRDRYYLNGSADELGFWSRVLSGTEITSLYNSGAGLSYDDFGGGAVSNSNFLSLLGVGS